MVHESPHLARWEKPMKKTSLLIPIFTLLIAPCAGTTVWGHNTQNAAHNAEHPHSPCYDPNVPGPSAVKADQNLNQGYIRVHWSAPDEGAINATGCSARPPDNADGTYDAYWHSRNGKIDGYSVSRKIWSPDGDGGWTRVGRGWDILVRETTLFEYRDYDLVYGWKYRYKVHTIATVENRSGSYTFTALSAEKFIPSAITYIEPYEQVVEDPQEEVVIEIVEDASVIGPVACISTEPQFNKHIGRNGVNEERVTIHYTWPEAFGADSYSFQWRPFAGEYGNPTHASGPRDVLLQSIDPGTPARTWFRLGKEQHNGLSVINLSTTDKLEYGTRYCARISACVADDSLDFGSCSGWSVEACDTTHDEQFCSFSPLVSDRCVPVRTIHSDVPAEYQEQACSLY
jgi:hypothetical protein